MRQQMKGSRMPDYKTKGGGKISTKKSISKTGQKLLGMKNIKKKPVVKKNIGKMLETFSPAYSIMKGKGPVSDLVAGGLGGALTIPFAQRQRAKRKKREMEMKGSNRMTEMPRMMEGGMIKRTRPIDGIARKGKTRAV
tara:strand:- start:249 stop:662 length:414 start_codon:yes stop_codon:yes gene_type:complete